MQTHELKGAVKAIKVRLKQANPSASNQRLSNDIIVSGVNIFGYLTQLYQNNKLIPNHDPRNQQRHHQQQQQDDFQHHLSQSSKGNFTFGLIDEKIGVQLKKIQKKDKVTKTKGLQDLAILIQDQMNAQNPQLLQSTFTFFLYHFCRILMLQSSKTVRQGALKVFKEFIIIDKKILAPHLQKIFPFWYICMFDPAKSVASLAVQCFNRAFPNANKKERAVLVSFRSFIEFLHTHLTLSQQSLTQDIVGQLSKSDEENVYDRVISSSLNALADSFNYFSQNQNYTDKQVKIIDDELEFTRESGNHFVWKFLDKTGGQSSNTNVSFRTPIRLAALNCFQVFLHKAVDLVRPAMPVIAKYVWALVEDKSNTIQNELWGNGILFDMCKIFQSSQDGNGSIWQSMVNLREHVLPKIKTCLKRGGFGAANALYQNFIRIVSVLPCFHFHEDAKDSANEKIDDNAKDISPQAEQQVKSQPKGK